MSLLVIGTVAFDDIETPFGRAEKIVGGAGTYIAWAASYFTKGIRMVVPAHSFKFAATLQEAQAGDAPTLIRIQTKAGHGSVSTKQTIELQTDVYAFTWENMGVTPDFSKVVKD